MGIWFTCHTPSSSLTTSLMKQITVSCIPYDTELKISNLTQHMCIAVIDYLQCNNSSSVAGNLINGIHTETNSMQPKKQYDAINNVAVMEICCSQQTSLYEHNRFSGRLVFSMLGIPRLRVLTILQQLGNCFVFFSQVDACCA